MTTFRMPDDLYKHQKEDVDKLLKDRQKGQSVLHLGEMGTGKTPVAIGLSRLGGFKKTLIVCPKSLKLEWKRQIFDWTGITPTVAHRGCYRRLDPLMDEIFGKIEENPYFIVNYETFRTRRHLELLERCNFDLIILDEAHRIRTPRRKQTKGMFEFLDSQKGSMILPMTGSPIVNNPGDLHTLLCIVKPEDFSLKGRDNFIRDFCYWKLGRYGLKVTGIRESEMPRLREMTKDFTIRHTKAEVLPWLPGKYYRRVMLAMSAKQREVYKKMETDLFILLDNGEKLSSPSVLSQLTRLRQLNLEPAILGVSTPSAKTDFIREFLDGQTGKSVLYSCFDMYLQWLHRTMDHNHVILDGRVPEEKRYDVWFTQFQNDPKVKLLLATIGPNSPGGEGITLTASSTVIFPDRWWTPTTNKQAEDRLHRIGQKNAVQVVIPVIEDSIDESFDKILKGKEKLAAGYFGQEDVMAETVEDLRENRRGKP